MEVEHTLRTFHIILQLTGMKPHVSAIAKILQHNLFRDETSYNIANLNFGV